jgi:hypothetical protein
MPDPEKIQHSSDDEAVNLNHPAGPIAGLWPELYNAALNGDLEDDHRSVMTKTESAHDDSE